jgi:glycosyltransferase involved in cell wall biosynthesis
MSNVMEKNIKALISIIVPTHNEQKNVVELHHRISRVFQTMPYSFELIFVDDSTDETPAVISQIVADHKNVTIIRLTRSFGQAIAISAGNDIAQGSAVVMMDADLQDPPEAIPLFVSEWEKGAKVVYATRPSSGSLAYRLLAKAFYRIQSFLSDTYIAENVGEFRLIDRQVSDFIKELPEKSRYLRGQTLWPGFKSVGVNISREERSQGQTNYNLMRSLSVAVEGLISFSLKPLRIAIALAFVLVLAILVLVGTYIVMKVFLPEKFSPGWLSLLIAILGIGAMNLFVLGIIGEYLGKIFLQVQGRPRYIIEYIRSGENF